MRGLQEREEEEKLKAFTPKERDEWRKAKTKPSGMETVIRLFAFNLLV